MSSQLLCDDISEKQEAGIVALLNEPTVARAAQTLDVAEKTIYRWLKDPKFQKAYREARREAFRHAIAMTQKLAPLAVQTLAKVMTDAQAPHTAKVSAAQSLLKFSRESIEIDELSARIEALEAAQQAKPWTPQANTFSAPAAAA
jgi:hypothetical protein